MIETIQQFVPNHSVIPVDDPVRFDPRVQRTAQAVELPESQPQSDTHHPIHADEAPLLLGETRLKTLPASSPWRTVRARQRHMMMDKNNLQTADPILAWVD